MHCLSAVGPNRPGLGSRSSVFRPNRCFLPKNERMSDSLKKRVISLIFGERPEQFAHGRSFLVSDLSDSLTSLTKKGGMSESLIFLNKKTYIKQTKKEDFRFV